MNYDEKVEFINNYLDFGQYLSTKDQYLKIPVDMIPKFKEFLEKNGYKLPEAWIN